MKNEEKAIKGESHEHEHTHAHGHKPEHEHGHTHEHGHKPEPEHGHEHGHTHEHGHKPEHEHGHEHGHTHKHGHKPEHDHAVHITVDTKLYKTEPGPHTVAQLKALGTVPLAFDLEQLVNGKLEPLPDNGIVDIKGGEVFLSHPKDGGAS